MSTQHETTPDLLRRFTPTPYLGDVVVDSISLAVQTNDPQLIEAMQHSETGKSGVQLLRQLKLRIVRDNDEPTDRSEVVLLSAGPLTTLLAGTRTVLVLDRDRREILGFLSSSISLEHFVAELLPILLGRFSRPSLCEGHASTATV